MAEQPASYHSGMQHRLDTTGDAMRKLGAQTIESIASYCDTLRSRRVYPEITSRELHAELDEAVPDAPESLANLLWKVEQTIIPNLRHSGHPRALGYVTSPGTAIAALGEFVAASVNANVTSYRSAPSATILEHVVTGWLRDMIGFAPESFGVLVSGGSMANFSALAAARAKAVPNAGRVGLSGKRLRVYASEEVHFSIPKAVALLGIGEENVRFIPTDESFRIRTAELRSAIQQDVADGNQPMCIVGNAGTVATGAVDPFPELAAVARECGAWLHIDGAYGALAALAPSAKACFAGIDLADSISLDPHKWLYLPVGCGCVLYKDPAAARAAFAHDAEYTRPIGLAQDEAFLFWEYGPELSRPFRALPLWMQIKHAGTDVLSESIEHDLECARHFSRLVAEADDFELLASGLSVFCFRYKPAGFAGDLDQLNEKSLVQLQHDGSSYLSNARVHGHFALRGCVLNYRTTLEDMQTVLNDVRRAAAKVTGSAAQAT